MIRLLPNLPRCVIHRHHFTRFRCHVLEHCRADVFAMLKKDEAIKGCAAWLSTTRGVSVDLLDGESQGETNEQAARARVRLVRAAAAKVASLWISFFFYHVQAAPCARLTMAPFLLLSKFLLFPCIF